MYSEDYKINSVLPIIEDKCALCHTIEQLSLASYKKLQPPFESFFSDQISHKEFVNILLCFEIFPVQTAL